MKAFRTGIVWALLFVLLGPSLHAAANLDEIARLLNDGWRHLRAGDANGAKPCFEKVLAQDDKNPYALLGMAGVYGRLRNIKGRVEYLEKLKQAHPKPHFVLLGDWSLIGPFDNPEGGKGLDIAYPPEKGVDLKATYEGKDKRKVAWQKKTAEEVLDISKWQPLENVVFYGVSTVNSENERVVQLSMGSDDGLKAWFNGQEICKNPTKRGVKIGDDVVFVKLRKGENKLLMKIEQGQGNYGLAAQLVYVADVGAALEQAKQQLKVIMSTAGVYMNAEGMQPNSNWIYRIYKGYRCIKMCRAGKEERFPPGQYDIAVGFLSGYVKRPYDLKAGDTLILPTGLLTFKQVTPPDCPSTTPQMLYHENMYLVTAYQGDVVRLFDGTYRVCYQDMRDPQPNVPFDPWHVIGPFPGGKPGEGLKTVYFPEQEINLEKTYELGEKKLHWTKLSDQPGVDLRKAMPAVYNAIGYGVSFLDSPAEMEAELNVYGKGGFKAWLNGELVLERPWDKRALPARSFGFVKLKKGKNTLLLKSVYMYAEWDVCASIAKYKMYTVNVVPDMK